jgi:hypothetical protein
MKKSILALGAAAVVGGLGLATSAQAVVYFNDYGWSNPDVAHPYGSLGTAEHSTIAAVPMTNGLAARSLELNPGYTGHELIVPYYSVQTGTATMMNIVNTDSVDGKVVKVRFRGAANSDDVLDFTVFLSPKDVWTAGLSQAPNGMAQLTSSDNSCTLPTIKDTQVAFSTDRFPSYLSSAQQAANTREGYVEILNMADIPPHLDDGTTNPLYASIKHSSAGVPACADAPFEALLDSNKGVDGQQLLHNYGIDTPTGGLFASWAVLNQGNLAAFSGTATAVRAVTRPAAPAQYTSAIPPAPPAYSTATPPVLTGGDYPQGNTPLVKSVTDTASVNGYTFVAYSPQDQLPYDDYQGPGEDDGSHRHELADNLIQYTTGDPLLTGITARNTLVSVPALRFDVPDLSTPLLPGTQGLPTNQAYALSVALGKVQIENEFVNDPSGAGGVPMNTDWVVSQPTRRYFAVVDYSTSATNASILYNDNLRSGCVTRATLAATAVPNQLVGATALPYWNEKDSDYWTADCATKAAATLITSTVPLGILQIQQLANGPVASLSGTMSVLDREESSTVGAQFSPRAGQVYAGEVSTLTFGNSPLNASLTNTATSGAPAAGWATFTPTVGTGGFVPLTGYAAEAGANLTTGVSFGETQPHRW